MNQVCFNGIFYNEGEALFTVSNRSFRYGDGLFETMKILRGEALLFHLHWERLTSGLQTLQIKATHLNTQQLLEKIKELCAANACTNAARVRLALYRNEKNEADYVLEATSLEATAFHLNEKGWHLGLFSGVQKSADILGNLKSANYLPYLLAGRFAAANGFDECVINNTAGAICDGSKTNIFLVKQNEVFTPALHQGCVAGVMRRYLLSFFKNRDVAFKECIITESDLLQADEIFLTNTIQGIRWVSRFGERSCGNDFIKQLYQQALAALYGGI